MTWSYLGNKKWAEVTRDERFFCQRLYTLADADPVKFVQQLNQLSPGLDLPGEVEWEVAFEVCFFRDMKFLLKENWQADIYHYSPKRTFDLCLFSENHVVVIEAKAQQGFESDIKQLKGFDDEKAKIAQILGPTVSVSLLLLASSKYLEAGSGPLEQRFIQRPVSWKDLAKAYSNDPVLMRADAAYEPKQSGLNNDDGYKTGEELLAAFTAGDATYIGRRGGSQGSLFQEDISSGAWRQQLYETRPATGSLPNVNWFTLDDFAWQVSLKKGLHEK